VHMAAVKVETSRKESEVRQRADQHMMRRPHVCGTAYGVKRTSGNLTADPCYVIYVDQKVSSRALDKSHRVPKTVRRFGVTLPTDVVELGPLRFQSARSFDHPFFIRDNLTPGGTLTCFVRTPGDFHALSCAHVIWGRDKDPNSRDPIEIHDPVQQLWKPLGDSIAGFREIGMGYAPEFGYLDAGLASISASSLKKALAHRTRPRDVFPSPDGPLNLTQIQNQHVYADSLVSQRRIEAVVTGVYVVHPSGMRFDLVIETPDRSPITYPGDSGMLWMDAQDRAVAMHIMGEQGAINQPSRVSLATFMYRIVSRFRAIPLY